MARHATKAQLKHRAEKTGGVVFVQLTNHELSALMQAAYRAGFRRALTDTSLIASSSRFPRVMERELLEVTEAFEAARSVRG